MKTPSRQSAPRGFTLVELLVTISIIAILAASAYGAYGLLIAKFRKSEAQVYAKAVERAVINFQSEYGDKFPLGEVGGGGEADAEEDTQKGSVMIKILLGKDIEKNAKSIDFLGDMKNAKQDSQGKYKGGLIAEEEAYGVADPWGEYYKVKMDSNYDNEVDNPDIASTGRLKLRNKVIVWSAGEDKNWEEWTDNVKSWE